MSSSDSSFFSSFFSSFLASALGAAAAAGAAATANLDGSARYALICVRGHDAVSATTETRRMGQGAVPSQRMDCHKEKIRVYAF